MGLAWRDIHGKEKVRCLLIFCSLGNFKFWWIATLICVVNRISDYHHLKRQIESEMVDSMDGQFSKSFLDLPKAEQQSKLKERLRKYCQKVFLCLACCQNFLCRLHWSACAVHRHTSGFLTSQQLSFAKQGSAWGKIHSMLILSAGKLSMILLLVICLVYFVNNSAQQDAVCSRPLAVQSTVHFV